MDNSPENGQSGTAKLRQPVTSGVRRKLIQSTLIPHKSQNNDDAKGSRHCNEEDHGDDEECCGSQSKNKKTRKRKPKASPCKASKKVKEKPSLNTPDKNLTCIQIEDATPVIPDLRSEARIAAEENSRMFAGKKIHPFFTSMKVGKNNREVTDMDNDGFQDDRKDKGLTCGPIHVFESTQDDDVSLDWRTWIFSEETFIKSSCLESSASSIFESSVECLRFDNLPIFSHPSRSWNFQNGVSSDKVCTHQECPVESIPNYFDISDDEQVTCYQPCKETEESEVNGPTGSTRNSVLGEQSRFHEERTMPHYFDYDNQPGNSLWIHKYQPRKAMEVCGNDKSVKFLGEWLQLWHERDAQISKNCTDSDSSGMHADDYTCSESEYDSDSEEAAGLKNVLLVTGPVGSGKSAAIHACAWDQGFEILEVSASECRNGALVKQRFGEALESHRVKRSLAKPVTPRKMFDAKSCSNLANGIAIQELDDEVIELRQSSNSDLHNATAVSESSHSKEAVNCCWQNEIKPLILFEDVDITFVEDRGFVTAIQQISKTAKRPIILTSNSHNPLLPGSLKKAQVHFTLPSSKEILGHLHMICAAEIVDIKPHLLERFVECCQRDIRKTIMQLQFWCQGRSKRARKMQGTYGSLLFDLEAGHCLLPKMIPWDLPSKLSELIEKEITQMLSMEEDSSLLDVVEELEVKETQLKLDLCNSEPESTQAKKAALLNRNSSLNDFEDFTDKFDASSMFSDNPGTSFTLCQRKTRRKNVVLSSDSEDETFKHGHATVSVKGIESVSHLEASLASNMPRCSVEASMDKKRYQSAEAVNLISINNPCDSPDVSCVPESTFVPETEIHSGTDCLSDIVSRGHLLCVTQEDLVSNRVEAEDISECGAEMHIISSDTLVDNHDLAAEFCHGEITEDSNSGRMEAVAREDQVMDESSRIDFNRGSKSIKPVLLGLRDLVQEAWGKFRGCHPDLRHYILSEQQHSLEIVKLTHRMSNLISETDVLFPSCQSLMGDFSESLTLSEELDAYNLSDERLLLASTTAQHGFCLYSKHISALGSSTDCGSNIDLASEMLASSTGLMALGKLIGDDTRTNKHSYDERCLDLTQLKPDVPYKSETKSNLFNVVQSVAPPKSFLALRGAAYYEYLSSLHRISKSEAYRISQNTNIRGNQRRGRRAQHYLSTGRMMLSPDQISLLDQHNLQM